MYRLLGEAPLTVGEVVDVLKLPQSTVSRHLKALRATGLLQERREGNRVYCALVEPAANGQPELPVLVHRWLREQPLPPVVRRRLGRVLDRRNGAEDAFERLAHQWDDLRRGYFGSSFHLEALAALLPHHWRVLDIGTGTGYFLPALSRHFREVVAVDPSRAMLRLARERAEREQLENVTLSFGQLESLPAESESIDAVLAILVLHHAQDLEGAAAEVWRVLRPGGRLLAVDIEPHEMKEFQRVMGDPIGGIAPERLRGRLEGAGFEIEVLRPLPPPPADAPDAPLQEAPRLFLLKAHRPE